MLAMLAGWASFAIRISTNATLVTARIMPRAITRLATTRARVSLGTRVETVPRTSTNAPDFLAHIMNHVLIK